MYLGRMVARSEDVFTRGVMVLSVQRALDFKARERGEGDRDEIDEVTGLGVFNLTGIDMRGLDPEEREEGTFRGSPEVKIRLLSEEEPVLPRPQTQGLGAVVQFEGLMVTPYLSQDRCNGHSARCRAELKYSFRATGLRPF